MQTSCGIYLYDLNKHCLLIGHVTNSGKRFSIPKGQMDDSDKGYLDCAIREFTEETNLELHDLNIVLQTEFPFVKYQHQERQLKSYLIITDNSYDEKDIHCTTFFENEETKQQQPEIDNFIWVDLTTAEMLLPISQKYNIKEIRQIISNMEIIQ